MRRRCGLLTVALIAAVAACGDEAPPGEPAPAAPPDASDGPDASIPTVDLSRRPVADDPDPGVRAGAVSDFVDCVHGIWQAGWIDDYGPLGSGGDPGAALAAMTDAGMLAIPRDGFVESGRDADRVLYTYSVAGGARAAVVLTDDPAVTQQTGSAWTVETFATCDPAEFDPSTDDDFPMTVWEDADGQRVPTSVVTSYRGPEHCGWESATFLTLDGAGYVSDPDGVFDPGTFAAPFDADAELPPDAVDTGYRHGGRALWLSADRTVAFLVTPDGVEAWPASTEQHLCA